MKIAVIGAGNIGWATAGHLALLGHEVRLCEFPDFEHAVREVAENGTLEVESSEAHSLPVGRAGLAWVGTDVSKALHNADIVIPAVPAYGERRVAEACAPWLESGQNVYLASGYMYGSVEFLQTLRKMGNTANIGVAETNNSIYAGRKCGGNRVHIGCYKKGLGMAAFPGRKGPEMLDEIRAVYPEMELWGNVFETGISNPSVPIHASVMVFNPRYVEEAAEVKLYHEGRYLSAFGYAAGRVCTDMDHERLALQGSALVGSLKPWARIFLDWYAWQGARGDNIFDIMRSNPGLSQALLPKSFDHRYLTEDVCMGLIPLLELLERFGLPGNVCRSLLCMCVSLSGIDLNASARTLRSLGLHGLSDADLKAYIHEGI